MNKILKWLMIVTMFLSVTGYAGDDTIVLTKENTLSLSDTVDSSSVGTLILQAKDLNNKLASYTTMFGLSKNKKPIYLFLNTPGGSIQSGMELIEALRGLGRPVHTITLFAASMGFQIVQNLNDRLVLKNGVMMSHRAQGSFEGYFGGEKPSQMDSRVNFWTERITELDKQTVSRTKGKQTLESYQKAYANELWMTADKAVDGGYSDRIVMVRCDSSLGGVTTNSLLFLGVKIKYDIDNCPLNTGIMNIRMTVDSDTATVVKSTKKQKKNAEVSGSVDLESVKVKFLEQYNSKQRTVVPMYW